MAKTGFIGTGNMGYAILKGLLKIYSQDELMITDANKDKRKQVSQETGVAAAEDKESLAKRVEDMVLAVEPQYYGAV